MEPLSKDNCFPFCAIFCMLGKKEKSYTVTEGNEEPFLNEKIYICLNADRKDPLERR